MLKNHTARNQSQHSSSAKTSMSFSKGSIFKARQSTPGSVGRNVSSNDISASDISSSNLDRKSNNKNVAQELTKNEKYCVSKLPALPNVFHENNGSSIFNGYSDHLTNYSLVVDSDAIHVWDYRSTDSSPLSFQFPLDKQYSETNLPLAILTNPSSGTSQDPGLVIINSITGDLKFYESVQHAPALGLINNKSLQLTINLQQKYGEYITLAENVEPAGIVVATSHKRVVLISIRDFKNKPHLSTYELLNPAKYKGFFSGFFSSQTQEGKVNDEIVSIKTGKVTNNGLTQEIIVQDSLGKFYKFTYNSLSANGASYIDTKRTLSHSLSTYLENNLEGFIPGSSLNIRFLDLWPLHLPEQEDIYVALISVGDDFESEKHNTLLLITLKIDSSGALLHGSHRLSTYDSDVPISSLNKPKLFVPGPGTTAFVLIENSIIITDINVSYINSKSVESYYSPRWEDVIKLKSAVNVIGQGYENASKNTNPALIILSSNSGVLRIERFPESNDDMDIDGQSETFLNPIRNVKSHIEQGIFYDETTTIDFDIKDQLDQGLIVDAISQIRSEILNNTSPYLPQFLPSIKDFLNLKLKFFDSLIRYSRRNFKEAWPIVVPEVVKSLEMTNVALNLWEHINSDQKNSQQLKEIVKNIVQELDLIEKGPNNDILRAFFSQGVSKINEVLTQLTVTLVKDKSYHESLVNLLVKTTHTGIYLNEEKYITNEEEITIHKSWIFDTDIILLIDKVFSDVYCSQSESITTDNDRFNLISLTEVLYFFYNNAIDYMQSNDPSNAQLEEYVEWYNQCRSKWIKALMRHDLNEDAIRISEKYHDFSALAEILETEKAKVLDQYGKESAPYTALESKYHIYFHRYGYDFAQSLYDHYIKSDLIQELLLSFNDYNQYLKRYFAENPEKTREISWIQSLRDGDLFAASKAIIDSANYKSNDYQDNRQLKFSMGKLAAVAARREQSFQDTKVLNEYINEAENNLIQVSIQNRLFDYISKFVDGSRKQLTLDAVAKVHFNSTIDQHTQKTLVAPFFDKFVESRPLTSEELISLLTFVKPTLHYYSGFADALQVAALISSDASFSRQSQLIWLRLLTTTDDWSFLHSTQDYNDEQNKRQIHETCLYKTLSLVGSTNPAIKELDSLVQSKGSCVDANDGSSSALTTLDSELKARLEKALSQNNLASWIEAILVEIKTSE